MIKPHQFIALGAAAVLSLLLSIGRYVNNNRWSTGEISGERFLPELQSRVGDVRAIEITQGGRNLTLARADKGAWTVREHDGYPAKPEAVRTLLLALTESELIERKTAVKEKLGLLELEDPSAKDAKSRGIRLLDGSAKPITSVVLGKTRFDAFGSGRGGTYARRADQNQSWLATGDPKVTSDVTDWVEEQIYGADTGKVSKLTLEHPGEAPLVIAKGPPPKPKDDAKKDAAADGAAAKVPPPPPPGGPPGGQSKFHLVDAPADKKFKKEAKIDDIVDAFSSINLEAIKKLDATPSGDKVSIARLELDGDLTVTFRVRKDDQKAGWISLEASGKDGDAKKQADTLNARAKGWEFKVPGWKADQILKRRADLFETT